MNPVMAASGVRVTMTEGPLLPILIRVAVPIALSNLFQSTYDIVNGFWVGRRGEEAIAAVAASGPLFGVLISLGSGLATAGAVLIEPIQGEAGVVIPPNGYLRAVRDICTKRGVLFMADEIQSGLGRTGRTFACDHEDVRPDVYILGKALGGGIVPVSAVVSSWDVMGALHPGEHGSTFGGNPLACAVGIAVVDLLRTNEFQAAAAVRGAQLADRLTDLVGHGVVAYRARGLWAGVDIDPAIGTGREVCEALMQRGVLAKDTHGSTVRLAPPLVVSAVVVFDAPS